MIGRLLLLEDHVIDGIEYASTHDMSLGTLGDMCCQMLFSWAEQAMNQSEVTYDNLVTVLRVIACCHGNRLVADALYCIQNVTVDDQVSPPSPQGPPGVLCVTVRQDIVDCIQPSHGILCYDH